MSEPSRSPSDGPAPLRPVLLGGRGPVFPQPSTPFVARDAELAAVLDTLRSDNGRLVTLVGPGGVGKTRLAIEVARVMAPTCPDGVRFVWLADVRDPDLVLTSIARAGGAAADAAIAAFSDFEGLLVLDNFEHLVDAAPAIATILNGCPGLTILITSRSPLRLSAEHLYTVPPLPLPSTSEHEDLARIQETPAVRLFVDRARARRDTFSLTPDNAACIAEICAAVDGLPLAIELAAAQVDVLPPDALLARLTSRQPLPRGGPTDAPNRHRSMRNAISWSLDLLDASIQQAFDRLAVFIGGFTIDAAAAVIGSDDDPLAVISTLVDNSLLTMTEAVDGRARYTMLEPIREFGLERLASTNDDASTRNRHAAYFLSVAEWSDWAWAMGPLDGGPRLARLDTETPNIRAALGWLRQSGNHTDLLRMASSLGGLWILIGHPREGIAWIEPSIDAAAGIPDGIRARALATLSWCVNTVGEPERALHQAEASVSIWRTLDDPLGLAQALILCAVPAYRVPGRHQDAATWLQESIDVLSSLNAPEWVPNLLRMAVCELGQLAMRQGDLAQAERFYRAVSEGSAADVASVGESYIYGTMVLFGLADIARTRGDTASALDLYQQGLAFGRRHRNVRGTCQGLAGVAACLAAIGNHLEAARVFGACEALNDALGFDFWREVFDRQRALGLPEPWLHASGSFGDFQCLRAALTPANSLEPIHDLQAASSAWTEGRALALAVAVSKALAAEPRPVAPVSDSMPFGLSSREIEVLRLLVEGHTDAQIAEALYLSRRTVASHLAHIYSKLDVPSRAAAAASAVRHGLA